MYGILADIVVATHVAYVAYVILGQVAILTAGAFKWSWGRNPYFRWSHLLLMAIVAVEAVMGWRCPLTIWEEQLRAAGGLAVQTGDTFMGRLLHDLLFIDGKDESFFTTLYLAMMVVVLQAFVFYPPRWFGRRQA